MLFLFLVLNAFISLQVNAAEWKTIIESNDEFTSTILPILIINTDNNKTIVDEPKTNAYMGIIFNGNGRLNKISDQHNHYSNQIGIELRGNSTQGFPKKPYTFETRDSLGQNLNVSLFGWPAENDWILRASYLDHTFIRNGLANCMSRKNGWWASRTQLVELVLNGEYQGIYVFMEKIKPDKGRVDIATLNPDEITEPEIGGGYIWEITGFQTNIGESRNLKFPKIEEAAPEQIAYLQQCDNEFRKAMSSKSFADSLVGYHAWINVPSFINELIVQEAMRNSDAYGWSGYFHKNKEEKINAGPVWDFDQSAGNSSYPDNGVVQGWMFSHPSTNNTPFFWPKLMSDPAFNYAVRHRWETLRQGAFHTDSLFAYIDSIAGLLAEPQEREFSKWKVLGTNTWRETSGYQQRNTYQKEVDYLKYFLSQRWEWMDKQLSQYENPYPEVVSAPTLLADDNLRVYPNPAKDHITIRFDQSELTIHQVSIYNNLGGQVQLLNNFHSSEMVSNYQINLAPQLKPGTYIYRIETTNNQVFFGRFIKIE